ncbi:bacillithiol biosynthesis deacetylase BshB1 [Mucilaginibacter sp. Bleaf8]|uniref:bacillithiol biosynthesis deacetylase BshB1 n=1 Tax=Mucilaginibacter sp. Bleaf8 TaxID=2834430 RepID=UPI001BD07C28|nr:bacillithiol biosynthesis deacetylase BshB1 [Mucilaginibacter sp. Bleaf8]MBS7564606.1 bacillithiol biosynthesis deacetylase BshB1 [Mucilaginibacter sp. Bleaf8]
MLKLDILVLAVHPDDAELGCAGTLLKHNAIGKKCGIVDLTQGELGTRGSAEIRAQEAARAAEILGLAVRENLGIPDGFFQNTPEYQLKVIEVIRRYQPEIIITNAYHDRHPDHGRASELVEASCFLSGLRKIETLNEGQVQEAWRPKQVLHFVQDTYIKPDVVVDITDYMNTKIESVMAYSSQFYNPDWKDEPQTYISTPEFVHNVEARAREFGRSIQAKYAEGFTSRKILGVDNLFDLR